ncbi:hypothetical protein C9J85_18405 [Haloferax sp. wsp5]|nr:hypothetical protein C9J85_18405 [Haloferax sp. wsp5]
MNERCDDTTRDTTVDEFTGFLCNDGCGVLTTNTWRRPAEAGIASGGGRTRSSHMICRAPGGNSRCVGAVRRCRRFGIVYDTAVADVDIVVAPTLSGLFDKD